MRPCRAHLRDRCEMPESPERRVGRDQERVDVAEAGRGRPFDAGLACEPATRGLAKRRARDSSRPRRAPPRAAIVPRTASYPCVVARGPGISTGGPSRPCTAAMPLTACASCSIRDTRAKAPRRRSSSSSRTRGRSVARRGRGREAAPFVARFDSPARTRGDAPASATSRSRSPSSSRSRRVERLPSLVSITNGGTLSRLVS